MKPQGIHLVWITVADIKKAIKFYTEVLGFTLSEFHEQYNWAELTAPSGAMLGIGQASPECGDFAPGMNSIPTISVGDIEAARKELLANNTKLVGEIQEIPEQVKLQTFTDEDGNTFQLCQLLNK